MTGKEKFMASMAADVVEHITELKSELKNIRNDSDLSYSHDLLAENKGDECKQNILQIAVKCLERGLTEEETEEVIKAADEYFSVEDLVLEADDIVNPEKEPDVLEIWPEAVMQEEGGIITIQQKIKVACDIAGISLTELGARMGMSQASISKRVKTGKFTQEELEKMAGIMGAEYRSGFYFPDGNKAE